MGIGKNKGFLISKVVLKLCEDNNIAEAVRDAKTANEAKKIIEECIKDGKKVTEHVAREVMKKLNEDNLKEDKTELEEDEPVDDELGTKGADKSETSKETENPKKNIGSRYNQQLSEKKELFEQVNIGSLNESIASTTIAQKDAVFIDSEKAKALEESSDKIINLQSIVESLKKRISELEDEKVKTEERKDLNKKKNPIYTEIQNLNDLLNNTAEKISVQINKELLVKSTKFVDENSLIKLESIIRNGYDLNSTIVQSILLAFVHQNSLL